MQQSRNDVENGWMRIIHALKVIAAFHEFDVFAFALTRKMFQHFSMLLFMAWPVYE